MTTPKELTSKFFGMVGSWINQNATKYQYVPIPAEQTEVQLANEVVMPERDYFSLTLSEMFLTQSRAWFTNQYPAVHSAVFLKFADRDRVSFSNVSRPKDERLAQGVYLNYPLVEMLPYNGGSVEIELALIALKGTNSLALAIDVLQDFAGLVAAPLGQALEVAERVTSGIQRLIDTTKGEVHLGAHQTFAPAGANQLRQGYFAVLMTDDQKIGQRLYVKDDRLYEDKQGSKIQYSGSDYVLYKVERTSQRPDWRLSYINDPLKETQKAMMLGEKEKADIYRSATLLAAMQAPDLTYEDRWTVIDRIKNELERVSALGKGAAGEQAADLDALMSAPAGFAPPRKGAPTMESILGG
jgi:hypothetical protein